MKKTQITEGHPYYKIHQSVAQFVNEKISNISQPTNTVDQIRQTRNTLLKLSDWTQMPDNGLSDEKRTEWKTYRQALRDITTTSPIVWPTKPN